jgi:predicted TIM-barrel fold metal-dependent hydrolase
MSGAWDCHAHLFGPYERFPLAADRSYTPPEATEAQYVALLQRLGMAHGVLVHPSAYGDDFSLLFHALERQPAWRGVVVLRADTPLHLASLRARGVRGVRFSHRSGAGTNFAGSASLDDLIALAPRLADAGLHAELWTDCQALPGIEATLRGLPVDVVLDHMGGFDATAGIDEPGFRSLLGLLEAGRTWVKLCAYRNLLRLPSLDAGEPFHRAMLQAQPERLVWGSDWPHLRVEPSPDTAGLLATLERWTPESALRQRILVDNPAARYG